LEKSTFIGKREIVMKKSGEVCAGTDVYCQNLNCPYFPCHKGADPATFNCKHCYCPLYFIYWENCGGNFTMLTSGIKDCSKCLLPHSPGGHQYVVGKLKEYLGEMKKEKKEEGKK